MISHLLTDKSNQYYFIETAGRYCAEMINVICNVYNVY